MTELEKTQEEFITYLLSILTPECKTIYKAMRRDREVRTVERRRLQTGIQCYDS